MISPLLAFIRCLTPDQKKDFVAKVGTTYVYIHQLATAEAPNPALRLAKAIVEESRRLSKKVGAEPLTYDDLLVGAPPRDQDV